MSAVSVVATSDVASADRLALWGDFVARHIGRLQSDTYGDENFDGRLELGDIGGLKLCRILASRHRVVRTPNLIRRDDRGYVKIVAQIEGAACFEQNGRRLILTPGEWSMYDTTNTYVVSNPERINQIALLLPRDCLTRLGLDMTELSVRRFSGQSGVGRLVFQFLSSAFADLPAIAGPHGGAEMGETIAQMVRLAALDLQGIATDVSLGETSRARVRTFIAQHLRDPLLSLDRVAAAVGCSKRNLHKLFSREGTTLNSHIWNSRLERVCSDLANPALRHLSITDIAFSWGFNSSAHFSRCFRDRYGVSPRAFRAMTAGSPAYWLTGRA